MSQDNKNLMLPTRPPTRLRAVDELYDLSYEAPNALQLLCRKSPWTTLKHLLLHVLIEHCCTVLDIWNITLHCSCFHMLLPVQLSLHQAQSFASAKVFFFLLLVTNNKVFYMSTHVPCSSAAAKLNEYRVNVVRGLYCLYSAGAATQTHFFPTAPGRQVTFPPPLWAKDNIDVTAPLILGPHRFDYRR